MKNVRLICGRICSGKDTFANKLKPPKWTVIQTSDIVKEITQQDSREQLTETAHLDRAIADILLERIEEAPTQDVAVLGIRQVTILSHVMSILRQRHSQATVKWLDVPDTIRKKRYEERAADKDEAVSFEEADQMDNNLGLDILERVVKFEKDTVLIKFYDKQEEELLV